jgi:hypothetical protein
MDVGVDRAEKPDGRGHLVQKARIERREVAKEMHAEPRQHRDSAPPGGKESGGNQESKTIETRQPWTPHLPMEDDDLVPEHCVLDE